MSRRRSFYLDEMHKKIIANITIFSVIRWRGRHLEPFHFSCPVSFVCPFLRLCLCSSMLLFSACAPWNRHRKICLLKVLSKTRDQYTNKVQETVSSWRAKTRPLREIGSEQDRFEKNLSCSDPIQVCACSARYPIKIETLESVSESDESKQGKELNWSVGIRERERERICRRKAW